MTLPVKTLGLRFNELIHVKPLEQCWYIVNIKYQLLLTFFFIQCYSRLLPGKAMATHSSTLAWKIPWTEGPGGLQCMGLLGVRHDWATSLHFSLSCIGEGYGNPLQGSCLENPRDRGAWWAAVYRVTQSRTQLKRLSKTPTIIAVLLRIKY